MQCAQQYFAQGPFLTQFDNYILLLENYQWFPLEKLGFGYSEKNYTEVVKQNSLPFQPRSGLHLFHVCVRKHMCNL